MPQLHSIFNKSYGVLVVSKNDPHTFAYGSRQCYARRHNADLLQVLMRTGFWCIDASKIANAMSKAWYMVIVVLLCAVICPQH